MRIFSQRFSKDVARTGTPYDLIAILAVKLRSRLFVRNPLVQHGIAQDDGIKLDFGSSAEFVGEKL